MFLAGLILAFSGCREDVAEDRSKPPPPATGQPAIPDDLRAFIAGEVASGNRRVVIPPGRYRVDASDGSHLAFSNLNHTEIIAEGVELVCTSTIRALLFEKCANTTIRGLVIDYDPLPFTQGVIAAMAPDKSWIEFGIAAGYPEGALAGPFQIYDPLSNSLRRDDARWMDEVEPMGDRRYRVRKAQPYRFDDSRDTEEIGDILVAKNRHGGHGSPHAVELRACQGVRFEDITVYASPSFGFLERGSEATTYLRCRIDRRPAGDDPVSRAIPRMRSLNADAFHSKDAIKGPAILSCAARFMGDDAVNINGRFHFVRGGDGRRIRIAVIDRHTTIRQNDVVAFLPFSGPRPPDARVVRRQPDPEPFTAGEKSFIRNLGIDADMRQSLLNGEAQFFILTLDREISLPPGSLVCCRDRLGNGFVVKDCDFGENRSRGILIKAGNGEISGNRIANTRMHAILVAPEYWWMEAGMPSDLVIRDNHIKASNRTPIEIHAYGGDRRILPAGTLRDISVINNRIEDSASPFIRVTSTTGLHLDGNILPEVTLPSAKSVVIEESQTR